MNITDIDDKIIRKSIDSGQHFTEISRHFENEFWGDLKALGCQLPDTIVRVSEFVPEIVQYIEKIIENGYAYESKGSVYFDVIKFNSSPDHTYAKLEPTSVDDLDKIAAGLAEGEGVLSQATEDANAPVKKNAPDFALWKASKPGEPVWPSPWGEGRPGWHIECSAMCHEAFKKTPIDIHTGGIDLRFPHHDNEIA